MSGDTSRGGYPAASATMPTIEPGDDQGDRVRQPERSGDDRDERGQAEQADQQLDRVRDRRFVHQTVTGNGPSVTRRRASAGC